MVMNMIGWFEIPVLNMERAKSFYEKVFGIEIEVLDFNGLLMGWFPFDEGKPGASGSLVKHEKAYIPSDSMGPLLYFSSEDVQQELDRIGEAGGKILQSKTHISEDIGYMALFLDPEGNRLALHSRQ